MNEWIPTLVTAALHWLALPEFGLGALFLLATLSATLLPMGSEAALVALLQVHPQLYWAAIVTATAGNTLGGVISWWMGRGAQRAWVRARRSAARQTTTDVSTAGNVARRSRSSRLARVWLRRWGARTCLLSWLPVVGDPLCAVAGWLHLPFWPCVLYMAVGKFLRYLVMSSAILWALPFLK